MKYELTLIMKSDYTEEKVDAVIKKYETYINTNNGEFVDAEKWGRRNIMSEFRRKPHGGDGYFVMINFNGTKGNLDKLDYQLKIDDELVRHMISRYVEPPLPIEKASA